MKTTLWLKIGAKKKGMRWLRDSYAVSVNKPRTDVNEIAVQLQLEIPDALFERPHFNISVTIPDAPAAEAEVIQVDDIQRAIQRAIEEQLGVKAHVSLEEAGRA